MSTVFLSREFLMLCTMFFVWNFVVFLIYGADKIKAKLNKHRISEKTLLSAALLMGGVGALLGMKTFRHKTKHLKFVVVVTASAVLTGAVFAVCSYVILFQKNF